MLKNFVAAGVVATLMFVAPAFAQSANDQATMCADALEAEGLAPGDDFSSRFIKSKGGSVKTVTVKLVPYSGGDTVEGVCKIKRGEVLSAEVKA